MSNDRYFEPYFFEVDFFASKLIMRKKKGSKILFKGDLGKLAAIDCDLRRSLSADYKKYFQDYCSN